MTIHQFYQFFENYDDYITHSYMLKLKLEYESLFLQYRKFRFRYFFQPTILKFRKDYIHFEQFVDLYNQSYIQRQMKQHQSLLNHINGYALDMEQKKAVITDEDHNLVVAGAGSGKTLTIIGKIRYLVEVKQVLSSQILCISFTRDTTASLKKAIGKETDYEVDVYTFHKLGIELLKDHGKIVKIADDSRLQSVILDFFEKEIFLFPSLVEMLIKYFTYYIELPFFNDTSKCEFLETMKSQMEKKNETFQGEFVCSYEEWVIANYFYMNQISYVYQAKYLYYVEDINFGVYVPCFYFPDYDFYLECYVVKQNGSYSEFSENQYLEEMEWKRKIHQEYHTKLEEIYSSYFQEGTIFQHLEYIIQKYDMKVKMFSDLDLYSIFVRKCQSQSFREFQKLVSTFIHLFKANGYDGSDFERIEQEIENISDYFMRTRCFIFVKITYQVYLHYQLYLKSHQEYDFDDMIYEAISLVKQKGTSFLYRYIIVDEYQDTSMARYQLIQILKEVMGAKVMVVGDDWQSIYRFTGCNLNVFLKFEDYFGYSKILKIQNTYRNSQQLIDVAGSFVMKNERQLRKKLTSVKQLNRPIQLFYYEDIQHFFQLLDLVRKDEVFILGRNNHDIDFLKHHSFFQVVGNSIIYSKRPNMKITFLTVHRSKGLECEEVILINLTNRMMGFPNKIADDPVLQFVNCVHEFYPYEEERRLFYVALTRTKSYVYLFVPKKNPSIFVEELVRDYRRFIEVLNQTYLCPKCGNMLAVRESVYGAFLGCSFYPKCHYTEKLR